MQRECASSATVSLVYIRLAHGVGRSGDIAAAQPKAAGSSIIAQITNSLLLDLIRHAGKRSIYNLSLLVLTSPYVPSQSIVLSLLQG